MNTFTLHLRDILHTRDVEDVISFVGEDATGSFGIMAGHERMITALVYGLARYRTADEALHYLMLPGGLVYFEDNRLYLAARRLFEEDDLERIVGEMEMTLRDEEEGLLALKESLRRLEEEMLRRLWWLESRPEGLA